MCHIVIHVHPAPFTPSTPVYEAQVPGQTRLMVCPLRRQRLMEPPLRIAQRRPMERLEGLKLLGWRGREWGEEGEEMEGW